MDLRYSTIDENENQFCLQRFYSEKSKKIEQLNKLAEKSMSSLCGALIEGVAFNTMG